VTILRHVFDAPGSYSSLLFLLAAALGLAAVTNLLLPRYSDSFATEVHQQRLQASVRHARQSVSRRGAGSDVRNRREEIWGEKADGEPASVESYCVKLKVLCN
jgi:hypothetical protein